MTVSREAQPVTTADDRDVELLDQLADAYRRLREQVEHRIVGQRDVLDGVFAALLAGGHTLLEEDSATGRRAFRSQARELLKGSPARRTFHPSRPAEGRQ